MASEIRVTNSENIAQNLKLFSILQTRQCGKSHNAAQRVANHTYSCEGFLKSCSCPRDNYSKNNGSHSHAATQVNPILICMGIEG